MNLPIVCGHIRKMSSNNILPNRSEQARIAPLLSPTVAVLIPEWILFMLERVIKVVRRAIRIACGGGG